MNLRASQQPLTIQIYAFLKTPSAAIVAVVLLHVEYGSPCWYIDTTGDAQDYWLHQLTATFPSNGTDVDNLLDELVQEQHHVRVACIEPQSPKKHVAPMCAYWQFIYYTLESLE